jgi:Tol biopolymer transport system component
MCRITALAVLFVVAVSGCGGGDGSDDHPIIFVAAGNEGRSDIYSVDPASREITNLTDDPANDFAASISPDGSKIAFFSTRDGENLSGSIFADLYAMNADGSNPRQIADLERGPPQEDARIAWDPDSNRVVFIEGDRNIVVADLKGVVHRPTLRGVSPVWSADGEQIVFFGADKDTNDVGYFTVHPYTLSRELLFSLGDARLPCVNPLFDAEYDPWWTSLAFPAFDLDIAVQLQPTNHQALYAAEACANGERQRQIHVLDGSFEHETVLTTGPAFKYTPRWSPDGSRIAYVSHEAGAPPSVWTMYADGSSQTLIAEHAGQPTWSPDGTMLAFVAMKSPPPYAREDFAMYVAHADGSDRRLLVEGMGALEALNW